MFVMNTENMKTANNSIELLQKSLKRVMVELSGYRNQYQNQMKVNSELKDKLRHAKKSRRNIEAKIKELNSQNADLKREVEQLTNKLVLIEKQQKRKIESEERTNKDHRFVQEHQKVEKKLKVEDREHNTVVDAVYKTLQK